MSRSVGRIASAAVSVLAYLVLSASPGAADLAGEDHPPVVTAPASVSGAEFQLLTFTVTASDPDGQAIETLTASGLPSGATFSANTSHTSGTFHWTPASGQAGNYTVTFTATNHTGQILRTGSATTAIAIETGDHPPAVAAPPGVNGEEGGVIAFTVSAEDPDGDAISSLTANTADLPAVNDASFTPAPDNTSGQFLWHMQNGDAGTYVVTFTATAKGLSATASTTLTVAPAGTGATGLFVWTPTVAGTYQVVFTATDEGGSSTFTSTIFVTDPLSAAQPSGTSLSGRAPVPLAPQMPEKGPVISGTSTAQSTTGTSTTLSVYSSSSTLLLVMKPPVLQSATLSQATASAQSIEITADLSQTPGAVFTVDHEPLVGGLASVAIDVGTTLNLQISAADPDGDNIDSFTADLSGLPTDYSTPTFTTNVSHSIGTLSWTPGLNDAGTYTVSYTAINRLVGHGATSITVNPAAAARVFQTNGQKLRLSSNKPTACVQIEPIDNSFSLLDVNLATVRMVSLGTGSVSEIPAITGKTVILGDRDNNTIQDIQVCFMKGDLRQLFSLLNGKQTVTVTIRGQLESGAYFAGSITMDIVVGGGGPALASVSPNPLNPSAKLSFEITKPGFLRVGLYDAQGRLVRRLADEPNAALGTRELTIDGKGSTGAALASGVYYYRIETAAGRTTGRFAIVR